MELGVLDRFIVLLRLVIIFFFESFVGLLVRCLVGAGSGVRIFCLRL